MTKFELVIEGPLSFTELREVMNIIDWHIAESLAERYIHYPPFPPIFFEQPWLGDQRDYSFVQIESARSGSLILTLAVSGAVIWSLNAVARGVRRSRLANELSRSAELGANVLADHLKELNDKLEDWSNANQRMRERKTKATLKRLE